MTSAEDIICGVIRGDLTSWPSSDDINVDRLIEAAFRHNVHLILFDTLKKLSTWNRWPSRFREMLERRAAAASVLDLIQEQELRRVLIRLDSDGIQALLLKGVPLAYTLYPSPVLRPRGDTDLLVRESDLHSVACILTELGYHGSAPQTDNITSYQCNYRRNNSFGSEHEFDIHWKINNAQFFANTFTFDELSADAIEIPSLVSCARGLGPVHALLLACVHRLGHAHAPFYVDGDAVYAGDHLKWIYDIHLMSSALTSAQWSKFTTLARTKSIAVICVDGLNAAKEAFKTQIPDDAMGALQTAARYEGESVQRLRASAAAWFFADLRALPDWRQRITFIKQVALPPSSYMMDKYQSKNRLALPFLYGYRLVTRVFKTRWAGKSRQIAPGTPVR